MANIHDAIHVLYSAARREIPSNGLFLTKQEFKKHQGRLLVLNGYVRRIEKGLKKE